MKRALTLTGRGTFFGARIQDLPPMPSDREYITTALEKSGLPINDLRLWEEFLKFAQEKHLHAIRLALEVDPKLALDFTRIIKKKIKALAHTDENLWYEALGEEQEIIKKYQV